MSSQSNLSETLKQQLRAVIDETLEEVRSAGDVAFLNDCRAIFRKQVPFPFRSYVASILAMKLCESSKIEKSHGSERNYQSTDKKHNRVPKESFIKAKYAQKKVEPENRYHGEGITIFISAGRRQRFYARIVKKLMMEIPGIDENVIGNIKTMDSYSFVVIDPAVENTIIDGLNGHEFKGRPLVVNRAKKKIEDTLPETDSNSEE